MHKFVSPVTLWFGEGSIQILIDECKRFAAKKVILFADPGVIQAGLAARVEEVLQSGGIEYSVYDQIVPEPPLAVADQAVQAVRASGADMVVAIGGGSALDLAKAAATVAENEGSIPDYLNLTGTRKLARKGLPKILIPTTSGTGSEVTDIAVFSLETTKDVITNPYLLADAAIVDPELTCSLPPRATAATGMDAFTHAVEAYISVNATTLTDSLALEAVKLISGNLRTAVWHGTNREARKNMAWGSVIAGMAFYNAGVSGVHALAYPIGGLFHVSHGESNSVLLPYVFDFIWPSCMEKVARIGQAMGVCTPRMTVREAALATIQGMRDLVADVGLPSTLDAYGIGEGDLDLLANDAIKQTRLLARSPKPYRVEDIRRIYRNALSGN
ncbi:iron-containing alcohol dehydrogenase [Effusibacillus lacus]|uniref:Alcohol dehydrogenase n=1 Tax=Effusibacillus lacus TaxID=1348429 RepID=A0A292YJC1_9BACL|nr:iron-containing alcohol dehydrogenase [Effusibacillus lacus]TCS72817.1 alcohol dehydrogenase class IV [Effusibacillus lacus]GAX89256.1 alcohol dehydrogenase [Effusibacillus lacus]